jgi:hypothetical protein
VALLVLFVGIRLFSGVATTLRPNPDRKRAHA